MQSWGPRKSDSCQGCPASGGVTSTWGSWWTWYLTSTSSLTCMWAPSCISSIWFVQEPWPQETRPAHTWAPWTYFRNTRPATQFLAPRPRRLWRLWGQAESTQKMLFITGKFCPFNDNLLDLNITQKDWLGWKPPRGRDTPFTSPSYFSERWFDPNWYSQMLIMLIFKLGSW